MADHPSPLDLDAIEARANAATPEPWHSPEYSGELYTGDKMTDASVLLEAGRYRGDSPSFRYAEDSDFCAHARTDVPALVARVRALEAENAELTEAVAELEDAHDTSEAMLARVRAASPDRDAVVLADVLRALRLACGEVGDNDWPDDLHPADVIDRHLLRPMLAQMRALEAEVARLQQQATDTLTPYIQSG